MQQMRRFGMSLRVALVALIASAVVPAPLQSVEAGDAATFKETVLYSFCNLKNCKDGKYPAASLVDVGGILYGTTVAGGTGAACSNPNPGCGTVFSLDPNTGTETVLHSFCKELFCPDGASPIAGLIAVKGLLYGTTFSGGAGDPYCCGTVFSLDPNTDAYTLLYAFCTSGRCDDGSHPLTSVIDVKSTLYGTTQSGGANGSGSVFALRRKLDAEKVLHSGGADGFNPMGLLHVNDFLYGTMLQGGAYNCDQGQGCGTLFALDPNTGAYTVLHSFGSGTDGGHPYAAPIALDGILYGTTGYGGTHAQGTVFSFDPSTGAELVLYSFCSQQNCADGVTPYTALLDVKGKLYGTTDAGGGANAGTVFSIDPSTGNETVLYSFCSQANCVDGAEPNGLIHVNGKFYGTTLAGGIGGGGTVFVLQRKS